MEEMQKGGRSSLRFRLTPRPSVPRPSPGLPAALDEAFEHGLNEHVQSRHVVATILAGKTTLTTRTRNPNWQTITGLPQSKKDRCLLRDSGPSVSFVQRGRQRRSIRTACRT
jgi:hypothetical protein